MAITVKIIAHSVSPAGQHIVTWELEYNRYIHSEFLTHRLFGRNAASSRAIPVAAVIEQVKNDPAMPIHWGKNQPGMSAREELKGAYRTTAEWLWRKAAGAAAITAEGMMKIGLHKQVANRILEPFQNIKVVMTATCMDNFFWLRNHEDAQPEIKELARLMWEALQASKPFKLNPGEWHVPYVWVGRNESGDIVYGTPTGEVVDGVKVYDELSLENALAISSSCCAQVSYRKLDDSLEKAQDIYNKLVESKPVHASPFEHQATPFEIAKCDYYTDAIWEALNQPGATHMDKNQNIWSGNLLGWAQHRQLIPDNACWSYKENNND